MEENQNDDIEIDDDNQEPSIESELEDCNNQKMRAVADYHNLKRRVDEERKERHRQITNDVIGKFLPIFDDIDRALSSIDKISKKKVENNAQNQLTEGIQLIKETFLYTLSEEGIDEVDTKIEFDPNLHEAIGYAKGKEGEIIEVVEKGFCYEEVVIRPARVVIGQKEK